MYEIIKKISKILLPKKIFIKNEKIFRGLVYLFYTGKNKQCNICNRKLRKFIILNNGDQLCPGCGSLRRNRRLWDILQDYIKTENISILDFSPSRCLYYKFKSIEKINYVSSDFKNEFLADKKYDITGIDCPSENFDIVICYHILEHIADDRKAIKELGRVLKPGGKCFIQTPFKEGEIYENPAITNPKERVKHFGQEDHLRIYSITGLKQRIEETGLKVEIKQFIIEKENYYGFSENEFLLLVTK
jgi:ubiquinone/menaquinone biosynthesis C-methylase UbiE